MTNNIQHAIFEQNLTQGNLALMVGIRREYLNRIINRRITPTIPLGIRIAKALKMQVEDLFVIEQ